MATPDQKFRGILGGANAVRMIATTLGVYTTRVFITWRLWQGGRRSSDGGYVDEAVSRGQVIATATGVGFGPFQVGLEIVPRPKIQALSAREIFQSGGIYKSGDIRLVGIQPAWTGTDGEPLGYTPEDVAPDPLTRDGAEVIYFLQSANAGQGGINGEYFRVGTMVEKFDHYEITLTPRLTTPTMNATAGTFPGQ